MRYSTRNPILKTNLMVFHAANHNFCLLKKYVNGVIVF